MEIACTNTDEGFSFKIFHSISDYDWWGCPKDMSILFCRKGNMRMSIDSEIYELSSGSLAFLSPGNLVHFIRGSEKLEFIAVVFSEDFLAGLKIPYTSFLLLYFKRYPRLVLAKKMAESVRNEICLLELAYENRDSHFRHQIIRLQAQNFLMNICDKVLRECSLRPNNGTTTGHMENICIHFILLVQKHHISRYDPSYYAMELQISERYLSKIVRTVTDSTARDIISLYTLSDIKCLLRFTRLPYNKISAMFRFSNASLFSRYFKNLTGISPGIYRGRNLDPDCLIESYE